VLEKAAMHTYADQLLDQLGTAYGEFWAIWLVPTALGSGVWCARLHDDHAHYINAESWAMLGTLLDRDDQLAGRKYSYPAAGTRRPIAPTATPAPSPVATSAARDITSGPTKTEAQGDVA
jgi:hypothetical protein